MGARFQVFLIARVPEMRRWEYRCVAAFHHQWCYGMMPLHALHRFFTLLRQEENKAVVRDELRHLRRCLSKEDSFINPAVPCPYTSSLLSISWTTDLELQTFLSGNTYKHGLMDVRDESCWSMARISQNDHGICVIDITDVDRPAYCFMLRTDESGGPSRSAYGYLRADAEHLFTTEWEAMRGLLKLNAEDSAMRCLTMVLDVFWSLVDLAGRPLISAETLREAWPVDAETFEDSPSPKQLAIPESGDLPMPLDIVISLYLGLAPPGELEALKTQFGCSSYPEAIGRIILPPYESQGTPEETYRRAEAIVLILQNARPFEYVIERPPHLSFTMPDYESATVERELLIYWEFMCEQLDGCPLLLPAFDPDSSDVVDRARAYFARPTFQKVAHILHPLKALQISIRYLIPAESEWLVTLIWTFQELGVGPFLNLSDFPLSADQVIFLVYQFPNVEALSLSWNAALKSEDIPRILSAIPSLRRLHVMHFDEPDLYEIVLSHPELFHQLESLFCPTLLICTGTGHPTLHAPVSFAFAHSTRMTSRPPAVISSIFSTPTQIIQALTDILPLAFQEHNYSESTSNLIWREDRNFHFPLRMRHGPNDFSGFPFYMTANMLAHASFACGIRQPGEPWSERRIVGVPIHGIFNLPPDIGQVRGTWIFHFDWDYRRLRRSNPRRNCWGFIYFEMIRLEHPVEPGSDAKPQAAAEEEQMFPLKRWKLCENQWRVHDLRGFLRCMADEGRPLPDPDAVLKLEQILGARASVTGELICPLVPEDEVGRLLLIHLKNQTTLDQLNSQSGPTLPNMFESTPGHKMTIITS